MQMKKLIASSLAVLGLLTGLQLPSHAARATLTAQSPAAILAGSIAANALDLTWTAADASNYNEVVLTGNEILLFWNTHASTAYNVTINAPATVATLGRSGDVSNYSVGAGKIGLYGPVPVTGFAQTNGKLYFQAENASVKFAVVKLRGQMLYK